METQQRQKDAITLIRTDKFNIGFMGRSGSRTIMQDIVGRSYAHDPLLSSFSNFNDKQILEEQGSIPHILVLRDPVERAASGSLLALYPEYHGNPFLHLIDFDVVTHILRFEDLGEYFSSHKGFVTAEEKKEFDVDVGLSDHTLSHIAAAVAIGMGASAIEKHFKLDADDCGPDSSFSLTPESLVELVEYCNQSWLARGEGIFKRADVEKENIVFRRSLYFVKDKKPGETITKSDVRRIRPGFGISPKYYSKLLGMRLTKKVERGDPVTWDMIE